MRANMSSAMCLVLFLKNLMIALFLIFWFNFYTGMLGDTLRTMFVVIVAMILFGITYCELALTNWIVRTYKEMQRG